MQFFLRPDCISVRLSCTGILLLNLKCCMLLNNPLYQEQVGNLRHTCTVKVKNIGILYFVPPVYGLGSINS